MPGRDRFADWREWWILRLCTLPPVTQIMSHRQDEKPDPFSARIKAIDARLRKAQQELANRLIEQRLDGEQMQLLKLQIEELAERADGLRRALLASIEAPVATRRTHGRGRHKRRG